MSYHTLTVHRGLRCGAHMFAAKMEYHSLGQDEVFIVAESFIGFKRWMIEYQSIYCSTSSTNSGASRPTA